MQVPPCAERAHGYSRRMRLGWGALIASVALCLLAGGAPAPAPMAAIGAATQPTLSLSESDTAPADDDARDVDNDDDSDDDASLTAAVALELPQPQRLCYRAAASLFRAPPDAQQLLRPPQLGVD